MAYWPTLVCEPLVFLHVCLTAASNSPVHCRHAGHQSGSPHAAQSNHGIHLSWGPTHSRCTRVHAPRSPQAPHTMDTLQRLT